MNNEGSLPPVAEPAAPDDLPPRTRSLMGLIAGSGANEEEARLHRASKHLGGVVEAAERDEKNHAGGSRDDPVGG